MGVQHSTQEGEAKALERAVQSVDYSLVRGRAVWVAGFEPAGLVAPPAEDRRLAGALARDAYLAARLVERLVNLGNRVVAEPREADIWLLPWVRVLGSQTTHREYRESLLFYYPVYVHDESHAQAAVSIGLYDRGSGELRDLVSGRSYGLIVEPFILDVLGFRLGF